MTDYEISKEQFKKKNIQPKVGKKVLFISFTDPGIMKVKIKKTKKKSVLVKPCEGIE